ncbi:PREDICTED: zinc finger BED domain-containing protein 1-like, partial [Vollenhovia emeryi]|uniref:zinc finger BED domain-containing protein 1-like n=1 Tax=Vollenhovia emeryi TaxID=411798 RepID=UPI0005F49FB3
MLTRYEIQLLKNLISLLTPIERVITEISGDSYPTASVIIPIIHCMQVAICSWEPKQLEVDNNVTETSIQFKNHLLALTEQKFKVLEFNPILAISTMLDSRFKKLHFQSALAASSAITKINTLMKPNTVSEIPNRVPTRSSNNESSIWEYQDEIVTKNIDSISNDKEGLNLELRQYLNQPVISRYQNSLKHWETVKSAYPSLYKVAMKYLSVVATSVPSERLFSRAGAIKVENRSRLS